MQVSDVSYKMISPLDTNIFKQIETTPKGTKSITEHPQLDTPPTAWQKNILMQALDKLENKIQVNNTAHPLDRLESVPIETYEEALIEISFVKQPLFQKEASGAQANINSNDVLMLFTEN